MSTNSELYLEKRKIFSSNFRSQRISKNLLSKYDLILVLEQYMKNEIRNSNLINSEIFSNKVKTLSDYAQESPVKDIDDPYGMDRNGYNKILDSIDILCKKIIKNWYKYKAEII